MLIDGNMKATFTIHKTCYPFLVKSQRQVPNVKSLRVPAAARVFPADCPHVRWIFTEEPKLNEYQTVLEEFPAYGSVLLRLAIPNLRTVIVTAAVYWGFSSVLRSRKS